MSRLGTKWYIWKDDGEWIAGQLYSPYRIARFGSWRAALNYVYEAYHAVR